MDYNELLKGIGDLIDQKLEEKLDRKFDQKLAPIITDIAAIKGDIAVLKEDVAVLKEDVAILKVDVADLKVDVSTNKKNITLLATRIGKLEKNYKRLETLMEHDIPKSISLLAEGHGAILEKIVDKRDIDNLKDRVSTTETVIMMHTKEIELLKKKA